MHTFVWKAQQALSNNGHGRQAQLAKVELAQALYEMAQLALAVAAQRRPQIQVTSNGPSRRVEPGVTIRRAE